MFMKKDAHASVLSFSHNKLQFAFLYIRPRMTLPLLGILAFYSVPAVAAIQSRSATRHALPTHSQPVHSQQMSISDHRKRSHLPLPALSPGRHRLAQGLSAASSATSAFGGDSTAGPVVPPLRESVSSLQQQITTELGNLQGSAASADTLRHLGAEYFYLQQRAYPNDTVD